MDTRRAHGAHSQAYSDLRLLAVSIAIGFCISFGGSLVLASVVPSRVPDSQALSPDKLTRPDRADEVPQPARKYLREGEYIDRIYLCGTRPWADGKHTVRSSVCVAASDDG